MSPCQIQTSYKSIFRHKIAKKAIPLVAEVFLEQDICKQKKKSNFEMGNIVVM